MATELTDREVKQNNIRAIDLRAKVKDMKEKLKPIDQKFDELYNDKMISKRIGVQTAMDTLDRAERELGLMMHNYRLKANELDQFARKINDAEEGIDAWAPSKKCVDPAVTFMAYADELLISIWLVDAERVDVNTFCLSTSFVRLQNRISECYWDQEPDPE